MRSLATALILTERETDDGEEGAAKVKGRIITTLPKAKEVRPFVERAITIARRVLPQLEEANKLGTDTERNTAAWKTWRESPQWQKWSQAMAPVVTARRRALTLLGNKEAVRILFAELAPRFADRDGGYTRILKLAKPRLGDAGARAILEFVGKNDRVRRKAPKPAFEPEAAEEPTAAAPATQPSA